MYEYFESIINKFPMKIIRIDKDLNPAWNNIFKKENRNMLGKKETEEFYTSVARLMVVAKQEKPDIHQTAVGLSKRVKEPNDTGWQKLGKLKVP